MSYLQNPIKTIIWVGLFSGILLGNHAHMEIIEREVDKLSEQDRELYEISLDGVTQKEIARICNISLQKAH